MTPHEKVTELLALSAAGLLSPDEERIVKAHLHECAECAARAEEFSRVAARLGVLPAPAPPAFLAARTEARLAAAADRREGAWLAGLAALVAWALSLSSWYFYHAVTAESALVWLVWFVGLPLVAAPAAAALLARRRLAERSAL